MTKNTDQRDQFNFNVPSYRSYRTDQANKNHQLFKSLIKNISDKNIINDHEASELKSIQDLTEASSRLALILQAKVFQFHRQLTESTRVEEKINLLSAELVILSTLNLVNQSALRTLHDKLKSPTI